MPTARPRYQVTETDAVARALDAAAQLWPGEPRSRLIVRTILAGGDALAADANEAARKEAIARVQGAYTDAYGRDYLRDLKSDWPA
ncbi:MULTISPECIES: hypothetical protein [unclassified Salinibacterium]|uniref:hypothetical protein n=1 Tax=unclassified Salinibacterium TaxID=2632331 RepID=UPI00143D2ED2|nr:MULTISPECIES: hypothetical protein [unclassified Salinibacterium]